MGRRQCIVNPDAFGDSPCEAELAVTMVTPVCPAVAQPTARVYVGVGTTPEVPVARWLIVVAACGLSLAAAAAVAQECPGIAAILPHGEPEVVAVDGAYAYVGIGRGLLVVDEELGLVVLDTTCVGGLFADGFESGDTAAWSQAWP
jgi:hypothetical protein